MDAAQKTVLIVEDNELNMKLFHDLLDAHRERQVDLLGDDRDPSGGEFIAKQLRVVRVHRADSHVCAGSERGRQPCAGQKVVVDNGDVNPL